MNEEKITEILNNYPEVFKKTCKKSVIKLVQADNVVLVNNALRGPIPMVVLQVLFCGQIKEYNNTKLYYLVEYITEEDYLEYCRDNGIR